MQARFGISGIVLVLSAGLALQTATACPREAVTAAVEKWGTVLAENNPDTITALYSKDAVLWGTLSPTVRSDPAALKAYFVGAFQALPKLTVKFGDQLIRVYGDTAVNTGYYTFSYTKDGETKAVPARYSFTLVKDGNDCKIVDHHSSAMPAQAAIAGPKEAAFQVVEQLKRAFDASDVEGVVKLFAPDAIFLGTVSPKVITTTAEVDQYFQALRQFTPRSIVIEEHSAVVVSDNAVLFAGFDTFSQTREGKTVETPARFTLLIMKGDQGWRIRHFHSSTRPKPQ